MTNKEAITRLKDIFKRHYVGAENMPVLKMCIEALEGRDEMQAICEDLVGENDDLIDKVKELEKSCEDCISRQNELEETAKYLIDKPENEWENGYNKAVQDILKSIRLAPPVIPVKAKGEWVEDEKQNHIELTYHCSECGHRAWGKHEKTNFCGECGADMRIIKVENV